jgi:hypothetical protein
MKTIFNISALACLLMVVPSPCFALWEIATVSKERAKELSMEVRSTAAGPNDVAVELEFKPEGKLKNFSRVDLRVGKAETLVVAALKEDRSKPGRVVVSFRANRTRLDHLTLWVFVRGIRGGTIYEVRVQDFVAPEKGR